MKVNFTRWASPLLNDVASNLFEESYGEDAQYFIHVLGDSPYEIALLSALLAYLNTIERR